MQGFGNQSSKSPKRPEVLKSEDLLAEASEPPVVAPLAAAAADARLALAAPEAERGVTPLPVTVFPVGSVRMLVGEGWISFVHCSNGVRISGFEAAQFKLFFEIFVVDVAVAPCQVGFEEDDFDFFVTNTSGHARNHVFVRVLLSLGGVEHGLPCAVAVNDCDAADDQIADRFDAATKHSQLLGCEFGLAENDLHRLKVELFGMLLEHRSVKPDSFVDLASGSCFRFFCRWGHGIHGVIISFLGFVFSAGLFATAEKAYSKALSAVASK